MLTLTLRINPVVLKKLILENSHACALYVEIQPNRYTDYIQKRIFNTVLSNFSCHANLFLNESLYKCYLVTKVWDYG